MDTRIRLQICRLAEQIYKHPESAKALHICDGSYFVDAVHGLCEKNADADKASYYTREEGDYVREKDEK